MSCIIEPKNNGPLLVRNLQSLRNSSGADIHPGKGAVALCRCGESGNKPFCDGTHNKIGFSGVSDNPEDGEWQSYVGKQITIHDNRHLCAHAGNCTRGLASVWRMGENPWIDPDGAEVEAIIAVIEECPSGALRYSVDGNPAGDKTVDPEIFVSSNGPYHVTGAIALNDPSRSTDDIPDQYTLCRCGASKNKPFCDGSHWDINFSDDGS